MKHLSEADYSAVDISSLLQEEADSAVNYILDVIRDYDHTDHNSEHFSNVIRFDDYFYEKTPKGEKQKATRGRHGIYVFVAKDDFSLTKEEITAYNSATSCAPIKCKKDLAIHEGDHFYQGSVCSEGNSLMSRLRDHYEWTSRGGIDFSLPARAIVKDHLYLYVFPVNKPLKEYPFFIKLIEKTLHNRRAPLSGSTRT